MRDVIESIEYGAFSRCMNEPQPELFDGKADIKVFPDGTVWAVCPYCRKKAVKIFPDTKIQNMPYKCQNSKCKKSFIVDTEG